MHHTTASGIHRSLSALVLIWAVTTPTVSAQEVWVTLLGTGSPPPTMDRFGPSILVEAGDEKLLFDVGRGAAQRLQTLRVSFGDITGVFLTHLHSDHVVGLPDLWLTGWLMSFRDMPLEVWGPEGTKDMADHLQAAYKFDVAMRIQDDKSPANGGRLVAHDITESVVLERNRVRVTAFEVDHRPVKPALGYRIDYEGRSVVLSGDTRFSENLIRHAKGVDLLIHEVASATPEQMSTLEGVQIVVAHHATTEEAAEVFRRATPKLAVFSHVVLFPGVTEDDVLQATRDHYSGKVIMGADLMRIRVAD